MEGKLPLSNSKRGNKYRGCIFVIVATCISLPVQGPLINLHIIPRMSPIMVGLDMISEHSRSEACTILQGMYH